MAPPTQHVLLKEHLPKAGFRWPESAYILSNIHRDVEFLSVLKQGYDTEEEFTRAEAHARLTRIFEEAYQVARRRVRRPGWAVAVHDEYELLRGVKAGNGFSGLPSRLFNQFFRVCIESRLNWFERPQYPFDLDQHAPMARSIDKFLVACRERQRFWWARLPPPGLTMPRESPDAEICDDERRSSSPVGKDIPPLPRDDLDRGMWGNSRMTALERQEWEETLALDNRAEMEGTEMMELEGAFDTMEVEESATSGSIIPVPSIEEEEDDEDVDVEGL